MEISRHLIEALGKESLEVKAPLRLGKIGIEQLAANIASFKLVLTKFNFCFALTDFSHLLQYDFFKILDWSLLMLQLLQ